MKKYIVKREYWADWGVWDDPVTDIAEIECLATEWGKPVSELMEQVDELTDDEEENRARYYIYDSINNGDTFDRVFDADSYEAALDIARSEWEALSEHDRARRSEFLFGMVSAEAVAACEDGMDSLLNYMTNVVNLKEEA